LTYGWTWNLGSINGIGGMIGVSYIYGLTYNQNHTVYGVACNPSVPLWSSPSTHLFAVDLESNGGYYPLVATTVVTDLGVPLNGVLLTPMDPYTWLGGDVLTGGYRLGLPGSLAIYGGGTLTGRGSGAADLVYYDFDTKMWWDNGRPPCLPASSNPAYEAIFALTTGIDGSIYGGTGYWGSNAYHDFTYLFAYNPFLGTFTLLYHVIYASDYFISQVAAGIHGEIYFLSQPSGTLWVWIGSGYPVYQVGSPGMHYMAMTVDLHGNVWLCDSSGNLYEYVSTYGAPYLSPTLLGPIVSPSAPYPLYVYDMAAGIHGRIYMAAYDGTIGYLVMYDPRKAWSPGARGTNNPTMNPSSIVAATVHLAGQYSLVECSEQGTVVTGTALSPSLAPAQLFYYYEAGNPDLLNTGRVGIGSLMQVAFQWNWDPPTKSLSSTTYTTVAAFAVILGVAAFAVILGVKKRQKKKP
jgi:hypothetical protein